MQINSYNYSNGFMTKLYIQLKVRNSLPNLAYILKVQEATAILNSIELHMNPQFSQHIIHIKSEFLFPNNKTDKYMI